MIELQEILVLRLLDFKIKKDEKRRMKFVFFIVGQVFPLSLCQLEYFPDEKSGV